MSTARVRGAGRGLMLRSVIAVAITLGVTAVSAQAAPTGASGPAAAPAVGVHKYPLAPATPSFPGRGGVQTNVTAAQDIYYCTYPFVGIAATPAGYIIGNCSQNTQMYRSFYSDSVFEDGAYHVYQGGYINGAFGGCGWIRDDRMARYGARGRTNCVNSPGDYHGNPAEYAFYANCAPGSCTDGSPANIRTDASCDLWANIRPWIPRQAENGFIRHLNPGQQVLWRYVTADNTHVLVHIPGVDAAHGGWGFVFGQCFNSAQFSPPTNPYNPYFFRSSPT